MFDKAFLKRWENFTVVSFLDQTSLGLLDVVHSSFEPGDLAH